MFKKLRKVPAAPDFEIRLQRRIAGAERPAAQRVWSDLLRMRRVPAFAFPLVGILILAFVSYLLFWQSGSAPGAGDEFPPLKDTTGILPPRAPVLSPKGKSAAGPEVPELRPLRRTAKEPPRTASSASGAAAPALKPTVQQRPMDQGPPVITNRTTVAPGNMPFPQQGIVQKKAPASSFALKDSAALADSLRRDSLRRADSLKAAKPVK